MFFRLKIRALEDLIVVVKKEEPTVEEEEKKVEDDPKKEFDKFRASVEVLVASLRGDTDMAFKRLEGEMSALRRG